LTNDQLRRAAKHPVEMYSRVDFNITLSMCSEKTLETIKRSIRDHDQEKKDRKRINNFLKFHLREYLDQDPELDWHEIHSMLNTLPIVELNRITEDPDKVVQLAKKQKADIEHEGKEKSFQGDPANILTIEDLNSMLMFLQKLPYEELHMIIEFTQLLLDFLSLPAHAKWRDEVVMRGRREEEAPVFYKGMFGLRQKLDKADAEDEEALEKAKAMVLVEDQSSATGDDDEEAPPSEIEGQLHQLLLDTAAHENLPPEVQLQRILHDHDDPPGENGDEDEASLVSLESMDSAIQVPETGAEEGEANSPLWRKIDDLRSRAMGMLDAGMPSQNSQAPMLPGLHTRGNHTVVSMDDPDVEIDLALADHHGSSTRGEI